VTTHVMQRVGAERSRGFAGLAGSRVDGLLPVRQALVDAVLARVPRWPAPVEGLEVHIEAGNRIHVSAAIRVLGFRTRVRLPLRLVPAMENGYVRLVMEGRSFVTSAVSWVGPMLGQLPAGIRLEGQHIVVDVRQFADRLGAADLAALLVSASFRSEDGVLWIDARAAVPDDVAAPEPEAVEGEPETVAAESAATEGQTADAAAPAREVPFTIDEVAAWLAGARVDADVRVSERLANDLAAAAHRDAQTQAAARNDGLGVLARAVRRPVLRFEAGALRLSGGADVEA
jgi:hypothetical protein